MKSKNQVAGNGVGLGTLLFLVFLILKLAEVGAVAGWSWWWVTSPLWIPLAIALCFVGVCLVFSLIFN